MKPDRIAFVGICRCPIAPAASAPIFNPRSRGAPETRIGAGTPSGLPSEAKQR